MFLLIDLLVNSSIMFIYEISPCQIQDHKFYSPVVKNHHL